MDNGFALNGNGFNLLIGIALGLGLSASCGFRVFVPLLVSSIATYMGILPVSPQFSWLGTETSMIMFGTATLLEIAAYYIPWVDNLLDTIAAPLSIGAGTLLSASFLGELDPMLQWGLGLVVGGGSAGVVQASTTALRLGSTATTGGLGNPIVSTFENILATLGAVLSLFLPFLMAGVVVLGVAWGIKKIRSK